MSLRDQRADARLELALLVLATASSVVVLWLVDTQVYTEPWTIDPWLYTSLMTNFDFIYQWFNTTYYAARLPQILPGVALNSFLTPTQAYVLLHFTLFLAGGLFLYLLVRRIFGVRIALFVYPAFLVNAALVDAHTWDYFDGFVIAYLSAGLYFLVSSLGRASCVRPALAGFFLAAAATTNLFATLLVIGAVVVYVYGGARIDPHLRRLFVDGAWFVVGATVLLVACGLFAKSHGGRFLFFMVSIEALNEVDPSQWKRPTYSWVRAEPRLLIPLFVAGVAVIAWRGDRGAGRAAVGLSATVISLMTFGILAFWEVARSGTFLQLPYYFSTLYPLMLIALATAVFAILTWAKSFERLPFAAPPVFGLIAGAAPIVAIYGFERVELVGSRGSAVTLFLMGLTLAAALILRLRIGRTASAVVAPVAAALAIGSVNFASAASATTYGQFETRGSRLADADETFASGVQLMDFMRRNGLQDSLPAFWYDSSADPALTGIQSLYYYDYTFLNLDMPIIDNGFRSRIEQRKPERIVLLCTEPTCQRAAEAMQREGYGISREATSRLGHGSNSIWVRVYELEYVPANSA